MEEFLRTVRRVCSAGLDTVTLRRGLAQRMASHVRFGAYAFSTCDPDTGLMTHTVAEGIPEALGRDYIEAVYPDDATTWLDVARRDTAMFSMLEMSPAARDLFRGHGVATHIHLALTVERRLWATWCMMRGDVSALQTTRSVTMLRRAAPHIARAFRAATLIDEAYALDAARTAAEDAPSGPGVVVLDSQNRPTVRTALAKRWLHDLADAGVPESTDVPLSVVSLAARLRASRSDVPSEIMLRLRGASGRWYALRGSLAEPDESGSASVVIVVRPAARREIAPLLGRLYGLSEREREVVAAVARGEPTKCIAASLGVSPYTIEEHLDRACRKIGVRGRKALVARLFIDGYAPALMAPRPPARHQVNDSSNRPVRL
jgi:DNA-binding NarL/FixJ family response regulator